MTVGPGETLEGRGGGRWLGLFCLLPDLPHDEFCVNGNPVVPELLVTGT